MSSGEPNSKLSADASGVGAPAGQYMLKSFRLMRADPLEFLAQTWRTYGDTVRLPIPRVPVYLINHPDDVREVLVARHRDVSKRTLQYDGLATVAGNGLLTADDPPWREHRKVVQPAFHHQHLLGVRSATREATAELIRRWQALPEGAVVDADAAMMQLALQVVATTLFGSDWRSRADELAEATVEALDQIVARASNPVPLPLSIPTPGNRRLLRARRKLRDAVSAVVRHRRANPSEADDLVQLLVESPLSATEIEDELVTFLIAGHETVASALTWSLYLISQSPLSESPDFDGAMAIVDEALRLYPPAWVISRKVTAVIELRDVTVTQGSLLIMSPWIVHRHPTVWEDPETFDPSRFQELDPKSAPAYLPFGQGPRLCIGRDYARTESAEVLQALLTNFRFEPTSTKIRRLASVTLRPEGGLPLKIRPIPPYTTSR